MEELLAAIVENTAAVRELIEIEKAKLTQSEWVTYKEACIILGISQNTNSKRRIDNAVKRYGLRYSNTRPRRYARKDILQLNRKVLEGSWAIPGN